MFFLMIGVNPQEVCSLPQFFEGDEKTIRKILVGLLSRSENVRQPEKSKAMTEAGVKEIYLVGSLDEQGAARILFGQFPKQYVNGGPKAVLNVP